MRLRLLASGPLLLLLCCLLRPASAPAQDIPCTPRDNYYPGAKIGWQPQPLTEGWALDSYLLKRRDMATTQWSVIADKLPPTTLFYEEKALARGVTYQWQVYAWLQTPDRLLVLSDPWPHDATAPPCLTIKPLPPMGTMRADPLVP
jgi:hypothetical protein